MTKELIMHGCFFVKVLEDVAPDMQKDEVRNYGPFQLDEHIRMVTKLFGLYPHIFVSFLNIYLDLGIQ